MSVDNFIPKLWVAQIEDRLTHGALLTGLANRQYEGTLAYGNTLQVAGMENVAVKALATRDQTITYDDIATTQKEFKIDQLKYAAIKINDVDQVQAAGGDNQLMQKFSDNMAIAMLEDQETFLHAQLVAGDSSPLTGSLTTFSQAWEALLSINQEMTEQRAPQQGRFLLINPKLERLLLSDSSKLTAVDVSGADDGLRNATIGRVAGFQVITSPYLDNSSPVGVGFVPDALSFASQIDKVEAMRDKDSFTDLLRALHVYGGKVMQPNKVRVFNGTD